MGEGIVEGGGDGQSPAVPQEVQRKRTTQRSATSTLVPWENAVDCDREGTDMGDEWRGVGFKTQGAV